MKFGSGIWEGLRATFSGHHEPEELRPLADLYWRILLGCAFTLLVLVFLYGTWDLTQILDDLGTTADTSAPPPPAFNRTKLDAVIHDFDARKARFDELKTHAGTVIVDPSR